MDKTFNISVRDRLAKNLSHLDYVCGNTGYIVQFDFDEEWDAYPIKTARFIEANGTHYDKPVIDDRCEFPQIMNTIRVEVGVFAGDLYTTTPAVVSARRSILSSGGDRPAVPEKEPYDQMMEAINADALRAENAADAAEGFAEEAKEAAENAVNNDFFIVRQPSASTVDKTYEEIVEAVNSGKTVFLTKIDGTIFAFSHLGPSGIEFVAYSSTKYNKLKGLQEMKVTISKDNVVKSTVGPVMARNYERLIFKGAVNAVYDGSEAVMVEIPKPGQNEEGGGLTDQVQADWNENDPNSKAYVKNRTHWEELFVMLPETKVELNPESPDQWPLMTPLAVVPRDGDFYIVTWNGVEYSGLFRWFDMDGMPVGFFGNLGKLDGAYAEDNGHPFVIGIFPPEYSESMGGVYGAVMPLDGSTSATISIVGGEVHKIPDRFINFPKQKKEVVYIDLTPNGATNQYTPSITLEEMDAAYRAGKTLAIRHTISSEGVFEQKVILPLVSWTLSLGGVFYAEAAGLFWQAETHDPSTVTLISGRVKATTTGHDDTVYTIRVNSDKKLTYGHDGEEAKVLATEEYVHNAPKKIIYLGDVSDGEGENGIVMYTSKAYLEDTLATQITSLADVRSMLLAGALLSVERDDIRVYLYPTSFFENSGNMIAITTTLNGVETYRIDCTEASDGTNTTSIAGQAVAGYAIAGEE